MRSSGISPSYEEMKESLNLKSKSGIHRLISALEERGFIKRLPHKARALEVVKLPETASANDIYNVLINHDQPIISESGIKDKEELLEIKNKTNIKTFLIGESLLKNLDNNSIFSVL